MSESNHPCAIRVRGLQQKYLVGESEVHALRGVDLDVPQGDFLGLVGVSGSGKSTLLQLIGGLDTPTGGTVTVQGQEINGLSRRARSYFRRDTVGFVFQSFFLVPTLTAEANIRLALTLQGVYGQQRDELAAAALDRVGLADRRSHRPGQLSVGQQQRVAVARAIVRRPPILLADEPTANLDRTTAHQLMELLAQLNAELGTTIVMVTHDEQLAARYCRRTVAMVDGQFVAEGAPA
ncbi:MAG TPA: ABC transporter ATP-binding protein [Lacipirellulaceae bacterium]|nr:ABC transporter ATP-binding protein [Lacipirellulaceae bacterium]